MADGEILITVRKNGANRVEVGAPVRIIDEDGNEFIPANRARFSLCRCGNSKNMPFCDGAHRVLGFVAETMAPPKEE